MYVSFIMGSIFLLYSHYLIQFLPFAWTGSDIADSFSDGRMTDIFFMEYFVKCLAEDDKLHRAESYGYRIFMPPRVCVRTLCHLSSLLTNCYLLFS